MHLSFAAIFFISKQLAGGFNPWITRSLVSLPVFTGKFLYSKVFKNYKQLQPWMGRRGEFSFLYGFSLFYHHNAKRNELNNIKTASC